VDSLVSGSASERKVARSAHGKLRVPKPCLKIPVFAAPAPLCRKQKSDIARDTNDYEREQFVSSGPIPDAAAQRQEAQMLFEHGRQGLEQIRQLEKEYQEMAAACTPHEPDLQEIREAMVQQVQLPDGGCIHISWNRRHGPIQADSPCRYLGKSMIGSDFRKRWQVSKVQVRQSPLSDWKSPHECLNCRSWESTFLLHVRMPPLYCRALRHSLVESGCLCWLDSAHRMWKLCCSGASTAAMP
jgi:hypothetical protein